MISLYENNMLSDLKEFVENHLEENNVYVDNDTTVCKCMEKGTIKFPVIVLSTNYDYIIDNYLNDDGTINEALLTYKTIDQNSKTHTYDIDFKNAMLVSVKASITILAKDVSDIVKLEELLFSKYAQHKT